MHWNVRIPFPRIWKGKPEATQTGQSPKQHRGERQQKNKEKIYYLFRVYLTIDFLHETGVAQVSRVDLRFHLHRCEGNESIHLVQFTFRHLGSLV